ncbi:MAG: hypothetical protein NTW22_00025 [Proteobacteria bacterium]|nr:hypothetical protein [Pseudomonadota bacterium]
MSYYDEIGLLNPSERQVNGIRLYGKENIHDLLLILSLKFLKFKLMTIKGFRDKIIPIREEFIAQNSRLLKEIDRLVKATKILEDIVKMAKASSSDVVLTFVKIYYAMQHLERTLNSKSSQPHLYEKSTKFKERFHNILQQINTFKSEDLLILCTDFLEEAYSEFPDIIRLLDDDK